MSTSMILKVSLGDDLRRIPVQAPASFSFTDLGATLRSMFTDNLPQDFAVQYVDDEGDTIVVSSGGEILLLFLPLPYCHISSWVLMGYHTHHYEKRSNSAEPSYAPVVIRFPRNLLYSIFLLVGGPHLGSFLGCGDGCGSLGTDAACSKRGGVVLQGAPGRTDTDIGAPTSCILTNKLLVVQRHSHVLQWRLPAAHQKELGLEHSVSYENAHGPMHLLCVMRRRRTISKL
jgi:hypothetical protein